LLRGLKGPISVKGVTFNGAMPDVGNALKPREIAAVLTFVRQAWGNKGTGEFTVAKVAAAKKDPQIAYQVGKWTAEQIKSMPAGDTWPGGADASVAAATPAAGGAQPVPGSTPAGQASAATQQPQPSGAAGTFDVASSVQRGQPLYMQTCVACHQPTGQGLPGAFPPLAGTDFVTGDTRRLIAIALKGIQGPMTVQGKTYVAGMIAPVLQFPQLKDDKNLADVLNYVRNNFGNKAAEPITPELVGKTRAEFAADATPFTEETLKNFK
jgi:mono/diheme cytochrome c family protein